MTSTLVSASSVLKRLYPAQAVWSNESSLAGRHTLALLKLAMTRGLSYRERDILIGQLNAFVRLAEHRKQFDADVYAWMRRQLHGLGQ